MVKLPLFDSPKQIETHFSPNAEIVLYHGDVKEIHSYGK